MRTDERRRSKIVGLPAAGTRPRSSWPSLLLTEELSMKTVQDTTYVRLVHSDHVISLAGAEAGLEVSPRGTRSERAWSWLKKRPVSSWNERDVKEVVTAKSKSLNSWPPWLGRPPADDFQFDPSKRWPQGW